MTAELLSKAQAYLAHREENEAATDILESDWVDFYNLCTRKIRSFAFRCGVCENDIADCLQDVWAELIVRLPTFRLDPSRGQFESWLFRIVQSKAVNAHRTHKFGRMLDNSSDLRAVADTHKTPEHRSEDTEQATLIWALLEKRLTPLNLQILRLRLIDQLYNGVVAARLGLTSEQVRVRFHRARRELAKIGETWSGDRDDSRHSVPGGLRLRVPSRQDAKAVGENKIKKVHNGAQQTATPHVPQFVGLSFPQDGDNRVDYVFQKLELGRRELTSEWKVEWSSDETHKPVSFIRRSALVAYAEICGHEKFVTSNWPRIVNAALAAGIAAGIATIIAAPALATAVFRTEFYKQLQTTTLDTGDNDGGRMSGSQNDIQIALSACQEANGPWKE